MEEFSTFRNSVEFLVHTDEMVKFTLTCLKKFLFHTKLIDWRTYVFKELYTMECCFVYVNLLILCDDRSQR